MRQLVYLDSARDDLDQIQRYITRRSQSLDVGGRFVERPANQCLRLASLPGTLGVARTELRPGLRSRTFRGYVILFRYSGDVLELVNIIEGHRDIARMFS